MAIDIMQTILDIAKVGAQKHVAQSEPVPCEDCEAPATESWAIPIPPFAEHFCQHSAAKGFWGLHIWPSKDTAETYGQWWALHAGYPAKYLGAFPVDA